jgi:hypothetical protein
MLTLIFPEKYSWIAFYFNHSDLFFFGLPFFFLQDCYLVYILTEKEGCTSMIFTSTCESTRVLAMLLRQLGFKAISINGQMSQMMHHIFVFYVFLKRYRTKKAYHNNQKIYPEVFPLEQ